MILFFTLLRIFLIYRADHKPLGGLGTSRWLEALWEPSAGLFALPGGLDMLDISGDGDARFICADLGPVGNDSTKVRVLYIYIHLYTVPDSPPRFLWEQIEVNIVGNNRVRHLVLQICNLYIIYMHVFF